MNLKFGIDDRPRFGQLMLYSLQWFVLAIAVVTTSLFIAVGSLVFAGQFIAADRTPSAYSMPRRYSR